MMYLIAYLIGAVVVSLITAYNNTTRKDVEIGVYVFAFFFWPLMIVLLYFFWLDDISEKQTTKKKQKDGSI